MTLEHTVHDLPSDDVDDDLLSALLAAEGFSHQTQTGITAQTDDSQDAPLSASQQRLWFLQQWQPSSSAYNNSICVKFSGAIDLNALEKSLQSIQQRHRVLRSLFVQDEQGEPQCRPLPEATLTLQHIDCSHFSAEQWQAQQASYLNGLTQLAFDLSATPAFRATAIAIPTSDDESPASTLLVIDFHHIVTDGWSNQVLLQELTQLYQHFAAGKPLQLAPLEIQYADYALWQQQPQQQTHWENAITQWQTYLAQCPTELALVRDNTADKLGQEQPGQKQCISLSAQLSALLYRVSQQTQLRPFTLLFAAWQRLLSSISNQQEFMVGVPHANRQQSEIQQLIGCFINLMPVRANVAPNLSFRALAENIQKDLNTLEAINDLPFEHLLQHLDLPRDSERSPLFQTLFNYQRSDAATNQFSLGIDDVQAELVIPEEQHAKYELSLEIRDQPSNPLSTTDAVQDQQRDISVAIEYRSDFFVNNRIQQWLQQFSHILLEGLTQLDTPLSAYSPLSAQQHAWLAQFQTTEADYAEQEALSQSWLRLFKVQSEKRPDAIAVQDNSNALTYAELWQQSEQRAKAILHKAQRADLHGEVIALLQSRHCELLVNLIAVMKTNAAWLTLEETHPESRWLQLVNQSKALLLVGDSTLLERFRAQADADAIDTLMASCADLMALSDTANSLSLPAESAPNSAAYVVFTSGSTGTPKGAVVTKRGMLNNQLGKRKPLRLQPNDRIAQTAPLSFDIAIWQMLTAPLFGATTVIIERNVVLDAPQLFTRLAECNINVMQLVPSQLQWLVEVAEHEAPQLPDLRHVLSIGEALPEHVARAWQQQFPQQTLINSFGPAECADNVALAVLPSDFSAPRHAVSIGKPTENNHLFVVDDNLNLVPPGSIGQLAVAGTGVGLGYLFDEQRSAESFVTSALAERATGDANARLYLTGDLVRYQLTAELEGELEYVGRNDFQVKIRGQRVELGEIEAALIEHALVNRAIVTLADDAQQQAHLVAYIGGDSALESLDAAALQQRFSTHLQNSLPAFMQPQYFVLVSDWPMNQNGKVDRKALPLPQWDAAQSAQPAEPITETQEAQVAKVWSQTLQKTVQDRHADFFMLGGHSLTAAKTHSMVKQAFSLPDSFALSELFTHSTLAAYTQRIKQSLELAAMQAPVSEDARAPSSQTEITPSQQSANITNGDDQQLPLSASQQRIWFLSQLEDANSWLMPQVLHLSGNVDVAPLQRAVNALVARHQALRTEFFAHEGVAMQRIHEQATCTVEQIHIDSEAECEQYIAAHLTTAIPLNNTSSNGTSLMRVQLLTDTQNAQSWLLVAVHHIIADHVASQILWRDLQQLWTQAVLAQPLNVPYAASNYAEWVKDSAQRDATPDASMQWWLQQLPAPHANLQLPKDAVVTSNHGDSIEWQLFPKQVRILKQLCQWQNLSLTSVLMSSWAMLLARISGQHQFRLGVPVAQRDEPVAQQLVACLINTIVLPVDLQADETLLAICQRTQRFLRDSQAHQHVPFEQLLDALAVPRDLQQTPLFQSLVNVVFQPRLQTQAGLPGLQVTPQTERKALAKFELSIDWVVTEHKGDVTGISASIEFNRQAFSRELVSHWQQCLSTIMDALCDNSSQTLQQLPVLSSKQLESLATQEHSADNSVSLADTEQLWWQRFSEQTAAQPNAIAVRDVQNANVEQLTFAELHQCAEALAATWLQRYPSLLTQLQAAHASMNATDTFSTSMSTQEHPPVIAILAPRCAAYLPLLAAIQRLGAVWLPLDHDQPLARWQKLLSQVNPALLLVAELTDEQLAGLEAFAPQNLSVSAQTSKAALTLEQLRTSIAPEFQQTVPADVFHELPSIHPQQLAYLLFTSGSTGTPKAVMVHQAGMVNNSLAKQQPLGLSKGDVVAQTAAVCFDICVWQLLGGPMLGGTTLILSQAQLRQPLALLRSLVAENVALFEPVPSWIAALLDEVDELPLSEQNALVTAVNASALRWCLPTGEALSPQLAARWLQRFELPLMNAYGPAECADDVAFAALVSAEQVSQYASALPIGSATANQALYVVNEQQQRAPLGVIGECWVSGIGVGLGYWNDADKTAQSFIDNPFYHSEQPDYFRRAYKTGDLVRRLPDGQLQFMGRKDFQLKLRGQRLEPGDIEAVLLNNDSVREAVVVVVGEGQSAALTAYVALKEQQAENSDSANVVESLKTDCTQQLPAFMRPALWQVVDALPRNQNGKVDRKALPAPQQVEHTEKTPLTGKTQLTLATFWHALLPNADELHQHSDFFVLGGHSLLATRVLARIQREWQVQLPLRAVFENPQLAQLANAIDTAINAAQTSTHSTDDIHWQTVTEVPREQLPLSFAQQRLWSVAQMHSDNSAYNMCGQLAIHGELNVNALQLALNAVIARHEVLRTSYELQADAPQLIIHAQCDAPLTQHDVRGQSAEAQTAFIQQISEQEAQQNIDLTQAPILRAQLVTLSDSEQRLFVTIHHIACDGWSIAMLVDEVMALYQAAISLPIDTLPTNNVDTNTVDRVISQANLPALSLQYADFAYWQRQQLQGESAEKLNAWWLNYLQDMPARLPLTTDFPHPEQQDTRGDKLQLTLNTELTQQLQAVAQQQHMSLYMLMMGGFMLALRPLLDDSGDDIVLGTDLAGRPAPELEPLIGCFVNVLPVRCRLNREHSVEQFLNDLRDNVFDMLQHQHMPLDVLVEAVNPVRSPRWNPLVQALFVMQNTPQERFELEGARVEPVAGASQSAKFDFALFVDEGAIENNSPIMTLNLQFATALFRKQTMQALLNRYEAFLTQIATDDSLKGQLLATYLIAQEATVAATSSQTLGKKKSSKMNKLGKLGKSKLGKGASKLKGNTPSKLAGKEE